MFAFAIAALGHLQFCQAQLSPNQTCYCPPKPVCQISSQVRPLALPVGTPGWAISPANLVQPTATFNFAAPVVVSTPNAPMTTLPMVANPVFPYPTVQPQASLVPPTISQPLNQVTPVTYIAPVGTISASIAQPILAEPAINDVSATPVATPVPTPATLEPIPDEAEPTPTLETPESSVLNTGQN